MKDGKGVFQWESGNRYRGYYEKDQRHGYGEMYWNDGSIYKGKWKNGLQHGEGILQMPDGRTKEGIFQDNKFIEKTRVKLPAPIMEEATSDENF